jgi:hypothetical protein
VSFFMTALAMFSCTVLVWLVFFSEDWMAAAKDLTGLDEEWLDQVRRGDVVFWSMLAVVCCVAALW